MRFLAIPAILLSLSLAACLPGRAVTARSAPLVSHAEILVTALASAGEAERRLGADRVERERSEIDDGEGRAVVTAISIDGGRSRLSFRESRPDTARLEISIGRLEWSHVREILGEDNSSAGLPTHGHLAGSARFERGAVPRADFQLVSRFDTGADQAEITVNGRLVADSLSIDASLVSTGPALSHLLFDLFRGDSVERLIRIEGPVEAALSIRLNQIGPSPFYEGTVRFRNTDLVFPEEGLALRGVDGSFPLRPASGRASGDSSFISMRGVEYRGVEFTDVKALGRLDPGALYAESMTFRYAGGTGRGALVVSLPDLTGSRAAFFGLVTGFEASELGRLVLDDTGCLRGSADATIELQTVRSRLVKFRADVVLETGVAAHPLDRLLAVILPGVFPASDSRSTWPVNGARFSLVLDPRYYDTAMLRRKFGADVDVGDRGEIVGQLQFSTYVRPRRPAREPFRFTRSLGPITTPIVMLMENIQMRLFLNRIARTLEAAGRASTHR